jgi:hypothetical protein
VESAGVVWTKLCILQGFGDAELTKHYKTQGVCVLRGFGHEECNVVVFFLFHTFPKKCGTLKMPLWSLR